MKNTVALKDYIINQLFPLCVRLISIIALYSFFRLLFYCFHISPQTAYRIPLTASHIPHAALFFHGIKFDLCAIFISNAPCILLALLPFTFYYSKLYRIITDSFFILINGFAALCALFDIAYFPYVLKRTTFDFFSYLQIGFDWQSLLPSFLTQFWRLLLILIASVFIIIFIVKITNRMISKKPVFRPFSWRNFLGKSAVFLVSIFISLVCMRGGFQTRPLGITDIGKDASIQNAALISNTPFTLIKSVGKQQYDIEKHYFKDLEEAETFFSPIIHSITPFTQHSYPVNNVIVLVLEGFSQYLLSGMNIDTINGDYQGYAPFLSELQKQSISFNGIANGHRTIEALPAIFGGIPKLLNKSQMETSFALNYSYSPVEVLKKHGFNTLFFHGAKNNSMGIESYCYSIGFEKYYGKNEYPNPSDNDGTWGISDRSYLQYVAQKLSATSQPFFASVLTLSSHNPYVLPKDADGLEIIQGAHPLHPLASYTDHAVREFFETVSQQSWYDSTLFIITADHICEGSIPAQNSRYMTRQIPLFFYHPMAKTGRLMGTMQQLDIMPSLFSYINIDEPLFSYGNNIFDTTYTCYSANFLWNGYQLIGDQYILMFDGEKTTGFFDVRNDILMKNNLMNKLPDEVAFYEQKLKAIIQSYTTRLIKNQLYIEK